MWTIAYGLQTGDRAAFQRVQGTGRPRFEDTAHRRLFGGRVRELRHERGWSQEQLAEAAGLDRSYLSEVEGGVKAATVDTIYRLAVALGVEMADLFPRTDGH